MSKGLADNLLILLGESAGISKEEFEKLTAKKGYKRTTVRDFLEQHITAGIVTYNKRTGLEVKAVPVLEIEEGDSLFSRLADNEEAA